MNVITSTANSMPSLILPGVSTSNTSFTKHRFDSDPSRFSLNLALSTHQQFSPFRAPLPSPPMSGSPPSESPLEPLPADRRRKRSETPVITAPASDPGAINAPFIFGERRPVEDWQQHHRESLLQGQRATQITPILSGYQFPQHFGALASGPSLTDPSTESQSTFYPTQSDLPSPRSSRRPKAHVASACVNCKRKHLRCDNARPCRRCIQAGKEDSCVDVTHKKRGRPPLKAEDSRPGHLPGLVGLAHHHHTLTQPPSHPRTTSFRDLRPQSGIETFRGGDDLDRGNTRTGSSLLSQPYFGQQNIPHSQAMPIPSATHGGMRGPRPISSGSSVQSAQPASPYLASPGYASAVGQSPLGLNASRPFPVYGGYSPQTFTLQSHPPHPPYNPAYHIDSSSTPSLHRTRPTSTTGQEAVPSQPAGELSSYHLPPIRPAPPPFESPYQQQQPGGEQWPTGTAQQQQRSELVGQTYQQHASTEQRSMAGFPLGQQQAAPVGHTRDEQTSTRRREPKRQKMHLGEMLGPREE